MQEEEKEEQESTASLKAVIPLCHTGQSYKAVLHTQMNPAYTLNTHTQAFTCLCLCLLPCSTQTGVQQEEEGQEPRAVDARHLKRHLCSKNDLGNVFIYTCTYILYICCSVNGTCNVINAEVNRIRSKSFTAIRKERIGEQGVSNTRVSSLQTSNSVWTHHQECSGQML